MGSAFHEPQLRARDRSGDIHGMLGGSKFIINALHNEGRAGDLGKQWAHIPGHNLGTMPALEPVAENQIVFFLMELVQPPLQCRVALEVFAYAFNR